MNGFLIIDKPEGLTSHGVVQRVRRLCRQPKAGHTGTLDPFATGVLPVALGTATRLIPYLDEGVKEYQAVMRLGEETDTGDRTGIVVRHGDWQEITAEAVFELVSRFTGVIRQVPPMHSALKRDGVPLYRLARKGVTVDRPARSITVYHLSIDSIAFPLVTFTVSCSRGTYVRTLAADMGERLGCFAHLVELRRTASGPFAIGRAITLEMLEQAVLGTGTEVPLITPGAALSHLPELELAERGAQYVRHGRTPDPADILTVSRQSLNPGETVRLSHGGELLAVGRCGGDGQNLLTLQLLRVLPTFPFT
ncbi:tRNA pseudouridine(55) synthase TruB [Geobacter argillaceus]|uniref:tRNA pseudouridine synthase B n=1 Tax=Geobacter argillaceus TaxID=345631 RepID=A0A562VP37_9BACT|nr:tRNA pseudouridine synthase B [Geobacter argillaceus]